MHYVGLVILTPKYATKNQLEDALAKYNEHIKYPEYLSGEVNDFEKALFLAHYGTDNEHITFNYKEERQAAANKFFEKHPDLIPRLEELYAKYGEEWNDNRWRINEKTGKWEAYSTYNPFSKWDWYEVGGRWDGFIKTKSGEFVNYCAFKDIDLNPDTDQEDSKYHLTKDTLPFCIVIDGEWYEKDEDEYKLNVLEKLEKVPSDAEVYAVDFHI